LTQALESLQEQSMLDFEILVVDNANDPKIDSLVASLNHRFKHPALYIPESQLGLHNARHAGAKTASGNILVFTDDDATFAPDWLRAYQQAFCEHEEMAAAGGPVLPVWETSPPNWITQLMKGEKSFSILSLIMPRQNFELDNQGIFFGVNMAVRKELLFSLGGFNPEIYGDRWLGDGETGLNRKIWQRKLSVGFVPDALVYHHIPAQRMTLSYFQRRVSNEAACTEFAHFHARPIDARGISLRKLDILIKIVWLLPLALGRRILKWDRNAWLRLYLDWHYQLGRWHYLDTLSRDANLRTMVHVDRWL
jgi:glycosyltransferase involved in cell wall biosynthesis